jgi:hypothetical protein
MAWKLITSDDLKSLTKGDFGPAFDELIDGIIIPAVGEFFAGYAHRPDFDKAERTQYFSISENQRFLFLHSPPVASSPAAKVYQDTSFPRTYPVSSEITDFVVYAEEGMIEKIGTFSKGAQTVKAVYTGGYLTGDGQGVPEDLRLAAVMQAKILFDRREELALSSRSLEGGSVGLFQPLTLPKSITMILDRYKVWSV